MTEQWRPEQLPQERLGRWARDTFPGGLEGYSPNPVPSFPTFHDQAASIRGVSPTEGGGISYNEELLKVEGVAPGGTYNLEFKPIPDSLHCTAGGIPQLFDEDFEFDGHVLTVNSAMDLIAGEALWVRYAYRVGAAIEPIDDDWDGPTVVGIPWYRVDGTNTVYAWWRMEGMAGIDPDDDVTGLDVSFHDTFGGYQASTFGNLSFGPTLAGGSYGPNIYWGYLIRPWYSAATMDGIRIGIPVGTGGLYDLPQPIQQHVGSPPSGYQG